MQVLKNYSVPIFFFVYVLLLPVEILYPNFWIFVKFRPAKYIKTNVCNRIINGKIEGCENSGYNQKEMKKTCPCTCPRGFSNLPTTLRRVCLLQCLLVAGRKSHFGLWPLWPFEKASSHYKKIVSLSERKLATITHGTWESKTEKTFSSKYAMVEHSHMTSDVFWVFLTYLP